MNRDGGIKKRFDELLFGRKKKGVTMQKQMSRIIVICCVIAVLVQAAVMVGVIIKSYVRREVKDTEYILQSANDSMNNTVQFLEERILDLQRDSGIIAFLTQETYDAETAKERLRLSANLFSDRNRQGYQTPFVTEIYLFNSHEDCVYDIYYPKTVREQRERREEMEERHRRFLAQTDAFYSEQSGEDLALCLNLHDDDMREIGTCIVVLSRRHIEEVYRAVEELGAGAWSVSRGEKELIGNNTLRSAAAGTFENTRATGFGLTLRAAVSRGEAYGALWRFVAWLLLLSALVIAAAAVIGSFIARRYVRPLGTIAEKIQRVREGDFRTKLGDYSAGELQQISTTFNDMTEHINRLINRVYETQLLNQQAQIKYLQAQMDPHFLFNVLSMIELKAATNGDAEVKQKISMLSKLLQGKIFRKNEIEIPLSEEMEIVEFYLNLQNSRFGDKITYDVNYDGVEEDPARLMVPRLSIEPVVENAVAHGLEPKEGDGHIDVRVCLDTALTVVVTDNGVGFDATLVGSKKGDGEKKEEGAHSGVGLMNTDHMIKNLYGEEYGVTIESEIGRGTTVTVRLPKVTRETEE